LEQEVLTVKVQIQTTREERETALIRAQDLESRLFQEQAKASALGETAQQAAQAQSQIGQMSHQLNEAFSKIQQQQAAYADLEAKFQQQTQALAQVNQQLQARQAQPPSSFYGAPQSGSNQSNPFGATAAQPPAQQANPFGASPASLNPTSSANPFMMGIF